MKRASSNIVKIKRKNNYRPVCFKKFGKTFKL